MKLLPTLPAPAGWVPDARPDRSRQCDPFGSTSRPCSPGSAPTLGREGRSQGLTKPGVTTLSQTDAVTDLYLTGLRNQHAVETQAIGTTQNQMPRMEAYAELHAQMQKEHSQSTAQAARLDKLLEKHGSNKSMVKEAVTGAVATVAGFVHAGSSDEVLKDVLAAIGYKAYEIASYKVLISLAEAAGASADVPVLRQSMEEEQAMGDWLGSHLPSFAAAYIAKHKT